MSQKTGLPGRLCLAATVVALAACAVEIDMSSHKPAHPINENVEFSVTATGTVDRVELWVTEYEIPIDRSPLVERGQRTKIASCNPFLWTSTLTCTAGVEPTSDHSIIVFEAHAFTYFGGSDLETYKFASGQYHRTNSNELPTENHPIPIREHSEDNEDYIDIVLVPDPDLMLESADPLSSFRTELADVIDLFFRYPAIREARGFYNFYYSAQQGSYLGDCEFINPSNMANLEHKADVVIFLHEREMRDCKPYGMDRFSSEIFPRIIPSETLPDRFSSEIAPEIFSSEISYDKSLVHESGHAIFGLRDERPEEAGYYRQQECGPKNIWMGLEAQLRCQAEAELLDLQPESCVLINWPDNVYKIDPEYPPGRIGCIMGNQQHLDFSDFGPSCMKRARWVYSNCLDGNCKPACPVESAEDASEN